MHSFIKTYFIKLDETKIEKEKIISYFTNYQFSFKKVEEDKLTFTKKSNLFEGWKMNPLDWSSEINISIQNSELKIKYIVAGVYVTPIAFTKLYDSFINSFKAYIFDKSSHNLTDEISIQKAKKQLLNYYLILIVGVLLSFTLSMFLDDFLKSRIFQFIALFLMFKLTESILNKYLNNKYSKNSVQII